MTTTLFKEVSFSLSKLVEDIRMGEIGLPDIQRPFVWKDAKVRDLFDSMYKGYPVGYFLFWENQVGEKSKRIGDTAHQKIPTLLIVDRGEVIARKTGAAPEHVLRSWLDEALTKSSRSGMSTAG